MLYFGKGRTSTIFVFHTENGNGRFVIKRGNDNRYLGPDETWLPENQKALATQVTKEWIELNYPTSKYEVVWPSKKKS